MTIQFHRIDGIFILDKTYIHPCKLPCEEVARVRCVSVSPTGLILQRGFEWDGASGPAIDTPNTVRASVVHDGLYRAIRVGILPPKARKIADKEMRKILKGDGMSFVRRWGWWIGVRVFGKSSCRRLK